MTSPSDQRNATPTPQPPPPPQATSGTFGLWPWLLTFAAAALVYLPTMAPGVLWGDSGDCQVRVLAGEWSDARELARAHVTYYAAAIGLHRVFHLDAALAANLVSALAGALTVANFGWLVSLFVQRRTSMVCGVALLLFSHTLWQLSTGAEVVTFSTMLFSFELVMVARFVRTTRLRWLVLAGLVNGLGWSTHNFAMLSWPAYVTVGLWKWRTLPRPPVRTVLVFIDAWLVGCLPLIVLGVLEYRRLGSLSAVIQSLLFGVYERQVFNTHVSVGLLVRQMAYVGLNFPTPLILLSVWGWWRFRRRGSRGMWWFLTLGALMFTVFAVRYDVPDQYTFLVHSYLYLVVFTAIGIDFWIERHSSVRMRVAVVLLSITGPLVYAAAPPLFRRFLPTTGLLPARRIPYREPYAWFLRPWRTGYHGAERYAHEVFDALPADAVLLVGDTMRRPLDYLQGRDRNRLDVRLPYRSRDWPWQTQLAIGPENTEPYVRKGRLFCASTVPGYLPAWLLERGYRFEAHGHVFRVLPPAPQ